MNVINSVEAGQEHLPAPVSSPDPGTSGRNSPITLRKSGGRPISFHGTLLGHRNGHRAGTPSWHELNLYQTDDGRFVADIRVFSKAAGAGDQFHVMVAETLEEAVGWFEGYDPRADVIADFSLSDETLSPAELMAYGAALKYQIADTVAQYRSLLAEFLRQLNDD